MCLPRAGVQDTDGFALYHHHHHYVPDSFAAPSERARAFLPLQRHDAGHDAVCCCCSAGSMRGADFAAPVSAATTTCARLVCKTTLSRRFRSRGYQTDPARTDKWNIAT